MKNILEGVITRYNLNCMDAIIIFLLLLGGWPLVKEEQSTWLKRIRFLKYLALFGCFLHSLVAAYDVTTKLANYEAFSESVMLIIYLIKATLRLFFAIFHIDTVVDFANRLNAFTLDLTQEETLIFLRYKKRARLFTYTNCIVYFTFGVIFIAVPIFESGRQFPGHMVFPFYALDTPIYEVVYTLCALVGPMDAVINAMGDSFLISALTHVTSYLLILQYRLEHLQEYAKRDILEELVNVSKMLPSNDIVVGNQNLPSRPTGDDVVVNFITAPVDESEIMSAEGGLKEDCVDGYLEFLEPKIEDLTVEVLEVVDGLGENEEMVEGDVDGGDQHSQNVEVDLAMLRHLKRCVQFHDKLIGYVDYFQSTISFPLFFELSVGAAVTCIALFQTAAAMSNEGPSLKLFVWLMYLAMIVFQLFAMFWACSEVADESRNVSNAIYFSDWLDTSVTFKRSMLIVMSRALDPIQLRAASFMPFTMEVFTNVMNSGYSYFNMVTQMQRK